MHYEHHQTTEELIKRTSNLFTRLSKRCLKDRGIAQDYIPFLEELWQKDGQNQSKLFRKINMDSASATKIIDAMEREQLITRIHNAIADHRTVTTISLTEKAHQFYPILIACRQMTNQISTLDFSNHEKDLFKELLKRMIASLEENLENLVV